MTRGVALKPGDDDLRQAVVRSDSWRGVMRDLGYATSNGITSAILQGRAASLGLDTSHFRLQQLVTEPKRTCQSCGRQYEYHRSKGCTASLCNSCLVNERRFAVKVKIVAVLGGKCVDCGYGRCLAAMHVHHLDAADKEFNLSGAHARSWASIEAELQKCVLLCANCHATRHHDHVRGLCPMGCIPSAL